MTISVQIKGVLLTLAAICFGVTTGLFVKLMSGDISLLTMLFFRFLFSLPLLLGAAVWVRGRSFLYISQKRTMVVRVLFGLVGITFWFLSVRNIPLGQATAIFQSSVLFVTLASPFFLGETIGIYRTMAVIVGLCGVILLTDPFSYSVSPAVIFALVSALAGAGLSITLRKLGKGDQPVTVAFIYNFCGFAAMSGMLLLLPEQFTLPSTHDFILLLALGGCSSLLQLFLTTAYRYSEAVVVASLRYLQIPLATLAAFILFTEMPSTVQFAGMGVVISSCMFIIWREFTLSRRQTENEQKPKVAS